MKVGKIEEEILKMSTTSFAFSIKALVGDVREPESGRWLPKFLRNFSNPKPIPEIMNYFDKTY